MSWFGPQAWSADARKILAADDISRPLPLHAALSGFQRPMALFDGDDDVHSVRSTPRDGPDVHSAMRVLRRGAGAVGWPDDDFFLDDPTLESLLVSESDDPVADEVMQTIRDELVERLYRSSRNESGR